MRFERANDSDNTVYVKWINILDHEQISDKL